MRGVAVELLIPHRLRRWVLPLGFLGLLPIMAITMLLPKDTGATFFWIARIVFVLAYFALLGIGYSRVRRRTTIAVDAAGVHEGAELLVPRASIEQVLMSRTGSLTTVEVRGATPIWIEIQPPAAADTLVAELEPDRATATLSFLATTTPTYIGVLAWMGIPVVLSTAGMSMLQDAGRALLIGFAVPAVALWLFASWWCMRRRRVRLTATDIVLPRLLGSGADTIALGELEALAQLDTFTIELRFASRRSRKLKIYDPSLVADFVARLKERAPRLQIIAG